MKHTRCYDGRDVKEASELWAAVVLQRECARCGGLMVPDNAIDDAGKLKAALEERVHTAWRCISCGERQAVHHSTGDNDR